MSVSPRSVLLLAFLVLLSDPAGAQTSATIPKEITCSGAELQFELLEDPSLTGAPSAADLAKKGLKLAQKLVGTGVTIVPGSVRLDEGTQPGGFGGRRRRRRLNESAAEYARYLESHGGNGDKLAHRRKLQGFLQPPGGGGGGGSSSGAATPSAIFTGGAKTFGSDDMDEGIVLSTGDVACRLCDNENKPGVDTSFSWGNAKSGGAVDADFRNWCKVECNRFQDMVLLEFQFEIQFGTVMGIKYVFASEEWPKYVNPLFADAFAFFIGDENKQNYQNIALTPKGSQPQEAVSISSINCVSGSFAHACSHCNLFYDNSGSSSNNCPGVTQAPLGGKGFALKGMTKMLSGEIALKAGRHTIKLVIADARDTEKDSAVFVAAKSMTAALPMCYTIVSKECGKVQEQFVEPVTRFPASHPVMSRTSCDGKPTGDIIPGMGKSLDASESCKKVDGGQLFYSYDAATRESSTTLAQKGQILAYVLRDSMARVYLVVELGRANVAYATATMRFAMERVSGMPAVLVKDDPTVDRYQWSDAKGLGRFTWNFKDTEGDGLVIGPFVEGDGWCVEWQLYELTNNAVDQFIFGSMENGVFQRKVVMTKEDVEGGVRLCGCSGTRAADGSVSCQMCDKRDDGTTCSGNSNGGSSNNGGGSANGGASNGDGSTASGDSTTGGEGNNLGGGSGSDGVKENGSLAPTGSSDEVASDSDEDGEGGGAVGAGAVMAAVLGVCGCIAAAGVLVYRKHDKERNTEPKMVLPDGWSTWTDEVSGAPCYEHVSGITQWEVPEGTTYTNTKPAPAIAMTTMFRNPLKDKNEPKAAAAGGGLSSQGSHARMATQLPSDWSTDWDQEGNKYYYRETDGLTSWVPPPGSTGGSASVDEAVPEVLQSHVRNKTELPENWGKDVDGDGNTYYYEKSTNETMWEPPPGSKKGDICF